MTQNELIELVLAGNQDAFRSIVELYNANIFRICLGFVHKKEDAEELTQDVFVNVYQNLHRFKGNSSFSTWIFRIAVNSSLNHLRKQKRFGFILRLENVLGIEQQDQKNTKMQFDASPE
jgi:RNA polymerase sigma-70 factor (ECF subfamily)